LRLHRVPRGTTVISPGSPVPLNKELDMNTNKTKATKVITEEEATKELRTIHENALALAEQAKRLEASLRLARGTREIKKPRIIDPARPFFVGVDASAEDLEDAVKKCISDRPRTLREIVELTGETNRNRVSGVLVKFQVARVPVQNLGTKYRALWWIAKKSPRASV
jgi:hypothetical protein